MTVLMEHSDGPWRGRILVRFTAGTIIQAPWSTAATSPLAPCPSLQALPAASLVDRTARTLHERLARGEWPIGARLPGQNELAEHLGVSVVVVREALARLKAEGLLESRQGAGVFVIGNAEAPRGFKVALQTGDFPRLAAVLEVRSSIEVAAAELAAARRNEQDIATCTDAFRRLRAALAGGGDAIAEDFEFHLAIADASHNEFYPELLRYLHHVVLQGLRTQRERTRTMPRRLEQVQDEHAGILQAVIDGYAAEAGRLMHLHLANAARRMGLQPAGPGLLLSAEPAASETRIG